MDIKVAIIEDEKDTCNMLAIVINGSEGYNCVGVFENGEDAIAGIAELLPHVVMVDIHLPGGITGIETVKKLKSKHPGIQFVMCTSLEDADNIFNALQAGATGYLTKSIAPAKIVEAIKDAYDGGAPMSSQIARKVTQYFFEKAQKNKNVNYQNLSAREQEILECLSKGYRYKEIASMLFISIETVRKHIHNMYEKLQVNSRTDALNKAFSQH
jgi:DNA-binding NarL/FixJ family response regulator